jgi:hypothetical protein
MCHATLPALADLLDAGLISSAATMVPCPWFPEVAAFCRENPGADVGVHLTLTCEYPGYRWGPLSTRDPASGLLDGDGYFHLGPEGVYARARPQAVAREIEAQVARAYAAGIDVTHVDSHQLSVFHPDLVAAYVDLATEARLPLLLLRKDAAGWQASIQAMGLAVDRQAAHSLAGTVERLEAHGIPLVDHALMLPLDRAEDRVALARQTLEALPPGLTHFVLHPAVDTPELRAITPDWPSRVADYRAFTDRGLREYVRRSGVQVLGYRELRDLLREEKGGAGKGPPDTAKR